MLGRPNAYHQLLHRARNTNVLTLFLAFLVYVAYYTFTAADLSTAGALTSINDDQRRILAKEKENGTGVAKFVYVRTGRPNDQLLKLVPATWTRTNGIAWTVVLDPITVKQLPEPLLSGLDGCEFRLGGLRGEQLSGSNDEADLFGRTTDGQWGINAIGTFKFQTPKDAESYAKACKLNPDLLPRA